MKQTVLMVLLTAIGTAGTLLVGPFASIAVYYLFAVLRPQFLWDWALPQGVAWSEYVAVAGIVTTPLLLLGVLPPGRAPASFRGLCSTHRLLVAFGCWVCLSYVTALNREVASPWFQEYLKIFVMFAVSSLIVRRLKEVWALYAIATTAIVYIAYEVNFLYLLQQRLDIFHSGYGGLDNNGAGLMLAMAVPLCIYAWDAVQRWWRWGFALAVPVLLHAVLMTYSRGAMVSLLVVSPLFVLRSRRRWQAAALAIALLSILPFLAGQEIRDRFFSVSAYEADASANSRFESWRAAIAIANGRPLLGVGVRNSNLLSHSFGADQEGRTIHSQYLQTLADSGYPALLLYLSTLIAAFWALRKVRRRLREREDTELRLAHSMAAGLETSLLVFCVGAMFLSLEVFELPYLLILLAAQLDVLTRDDNDALPVTAGVAEAAAVRGTV